MLLKKYADKNYSVSHMHVFYYYPVIDQVARQPGQVKKQLKRLGAEYGQSTHILHFIIDKDKDS